MTRSGWEMRLVIGLAGGGEDYRVEEEQGVG